MSVTLCSNGFSRYEIGRPIWNPKSYRCHLALVRESDGEHSAIVLNLPGAGSCGATEEEAVANVREAVLGVIRSYLEDGMDIPWQDSDPTDIPEGARQKWILVDA